MLGLTLVVFTTPTALSAHRKHPEQAMRNQTVSALGNRYPALHNSRLMKPRQDPLNAYLLYPLD